MNKIPFNILSITNHNAFHHVVSVTFFSARYVICFGVCLCLSVCACVCDCACCDLYFSCHLLVVIRPSLNIACFPSPRSAQTDMGGRQLLQLTSVI